MQGNGGKCALRLRPILSFANLVNVVNERMFFLCFILRVEKYFLLELNFFVVWFSGIKYFYVFISCDN